MPRYLDDLIEATEAPANSFLHLSVPIEGVSRDRKMTKANFFAASIPREVAGKYRFKTDGSFQLWNVTQSRWCELTITGTAGEEQLNIGASEAP